MLVTSAGHDTFDTVVVFHRLVRGLNIKILLNALVASGDLTLKQRNELLYSMTNDVADIVINDCYRQTQSISVSSLLGAEQTAALYEVQGQDWLGVAMNFDVWRSPGMRLLVAMPISSISARRAASSWSTILPARL